METQAIEGSVARQAPLVQHGSEVLKLLRSDHPGMVLVSLPLDRVASWLLNAMTKNISNAFIYAKSARTLRIVLTARYGECNGPQLYQLERDIASITQGDLTKVDYFTKIQMLLDELAQLRPMPECTCGCVCSCNLAKATTARLNRGNFIQFLMGLNDKYDNVRSQILVTEPLSSVNRAYSMILRVKRQRQVHLDVTVRHDGAVMHAGNFEKWKEGKNFKRKGVVDKRSLKCEHCNKSSRDKSTCFKLHGRIGTKIWVTKNERVMLDIELMIHMILFR
ncbi:UNVERIFIED_CONTAM: hypothetical protein Sradi_2514900 [Sesamum radiatum]|uniref:Uncharacterized protein n=1 Tax=Sesamum radiatum TaxID=300843 RepID=A0AAW2SMR8_SESRA